MPPLKPTLRPEIIEFVTRRTSVHPAQNPYFLLRHAQNPITQPTISRLYTSNALSFYLPKQQKGTSPAHQYQSLAPHYHNSVIDLYLHDTQHPQAPHHPPHSQSPDNLPSSSHIPPTSSPPAPASSTVASLSHPPSGRLKRTPLYDFHVRHGARMVPFASYEMPVQYSSQSIGDSHRWVREQCGLFDVGHMVQHELSGPSAIPLLEQMTPCDPGSIGVGRSTLTVLLHDDGTGGIVDDCVVTNLGQGRWYLVTNAGCREKDLAFIQAEILKLKEKGEQQEVGWKVLEDRGLVALQGPKSVEVLEAVLAGMGSKPNLKTLYFGSCLPITLHQTISSPSSPSTSPANPGTPTSVTTDYPLLICRGGYTGEDGFEISLPAALTPQFCASLLAYASPTTPRSSPCKLAGLGARDSLRLEAGMCLYGHDLDDSTTPVEAGLQWTVHPNRRSLETTKPFNGSEKILRQLLPKKEGGIPPSRRRIGLVVEAGAPAREGAKIFAPGGTKDEEELGVVTSGCPSPTLGENIAMGYVSTKDGRHKAGSEVEVLVRGKRRKAKVTKMPFLPSRYWRGPVEGTAPG